MNIFGRKKWRKVIVHLGVIEWEELNVIAWDWVDNFWQKHDQPLLYFARYADKSGSRFELQVKWEREDSELVAWFQGGNVVDIEIQATDGSDAHAAAYLLARELRGKGEPLTKDTLHWTLNMVGYSYAGEIRVLAEQVAAMTANQEQGSLR